MTKKTSPRRRVNLEKEIIVAVVILYLLIAVVMITVHYLQPPGQETETSSTSPSQVSQSSMHGRRSSQAMEAAIR